MIDAGIDIINPVQCSAKGMDPRMLKAKYRGRLVFWGGGVDTQQTLPFRTPAEVRREVLERCEIFSDGGGFVFDSIHNVQAGTRVENMVAMFDAVREHMAADNARSLRRFEGISSLRGRRGAAMRPRTRPLAR